MIGEGLAASKHLKSAWDRTWHPYQTPSLDIPFIHLSGRCNNARRIASAAKSSDPAVACDGKGGGSTLESTAVETMVRGLSSTLTTPLLHTLRVACLLWPMLCAPLRMMMDSAGCCIMRWDAFQGTLIHSLVPVPEHDERPDRIGEAHGAWQLWTKVWTKVWHKGCGKTRGGIDHMHH